MNEYVVDNENELNENLVSLVVNILALIIIENVGFILHLCTYIVSVDSPPQLPYPYLSYFIFTLFSSPRFTGCHMHSIALFVFSIFPLPGWFCFLFYSLLNCITCNHTYTHLFKHLK